MQKTPASVLDSVTGSDNPKLELIGRMAAAIAAIAEEQGGCLPQDLNEHGFTPAEVFQHWPVAFALAMVELKQTRNRQQETTATQGRM